MSKDLTFAGASPAGHHQPLALAHFQRQVRHDALAPRRDYVAAFHHHAHLFLALARAALLLPLDLRQLLLVLELIEHLLHLRGAVDLARHLPQ